MLTLEIKESGIRDFMNKLLREDMFDGFEVRGVELITFTRFELSGVLYKDKDGEGETEGGRIYCTWGELRSIVFHIIKGAKKPRLMRLVFSHPAETIQSFHSNAAALFLNIAYENDSIICTTATSQKNFSLDRKLDDTWEEYIRDFMLKNKIVSTL